MVTFHSSSIDMEAHQPVPDRRPIILGLDISFVIISTIIISMRLYSRVIHTKTAGLDDILAAFAWLFTVAETSVEIAASPGTGRHLKDISPAYLPKLFQLIFALQILYLFAIALTRLSILAFLPRLNQFDRFRRLLQCVAVFIVLMTTAFFITALVLFMPASGPVHATAQSAGIRSPASQRMFFDAHQGFGLCIDIFLLATPLWLIYSNMTQMRSNVGVIMIFSVGLFEVVADSVRLVMLQRIDGGNGNSWAFYIVAVWTTVELHVGFWVACFPALVPLFRILVHRLGLSYDSSTAIDTSVDNKGWSGNKGSSFGQNGVPSPIIREHVSFADPTLSFPGNLDSADGTEAHSETQSDHKVETSAVYNASRNIWQDHENTHVYY